MNIQERTYWNQRTYGQAIRIRRWQISGTLMLLAIVIPIVFPIIAVPALMKYVFKQDIIWRYEK